MTRTVIACWFWVPTNFNCDCLGNYAGNKYRWARTSLEFDILFRRTNGHEITPDASFMCRTSGEVFVIEFQFYKSETQSGLKANVRGCRDSGTVMNLSRLTISDLWEQIPAGNQKLPSRKLQNTVLPEQITRRFFSDVVGRFVVTITFPG